MRTKIKNQELVCRDCGRPITRNQVPLCDSCLEKRIVESLKDVNDEKGE